MKVTLEFDCTPEEFRRLMGLPDVTEFNEQLGSKMSEAISQAQLQMDPETLMKIWFPMGLDSVTDMQKAFWSNITSGLQGTTRDK